MGSSSILFQNKDKSAVLLDLPGSIEEAQELPDKLDADTPSRRRLVSVKPIETPFQVPEPKTPAPLLHPSAQVTELMTTAAVSHALEEVRSSYPGPWCLPRVYEQPGAESRKRKLDTVEDGSPATLLPDSNVLLPEGSTYLLGSIASQREAFLTQAPKFDLIVLDPPWPNRSVRRKQGSYSIADSLDEIRGILSSIPVAAHLAPAGLVAVWVTNKPAILELLTSHHGLFAEWGLELLDEWTWLKVTSSGEPIYPIDSQWRKPWERILITGKPGQTRKWPGKGRVIISVPDVHSRKPNLRPLFDELIPPKPQALEIFARNLTAGWWSWGDEVLKFQKCEHWIDSGPEDVSSIV